jgi:hypothetical protein
VRIQHGGTVAATCGQTPDISPEEWAAIQQSTGYPHGKTPSIHQAQRWLHELLTGNPIEMAHPDIAARHKIWPQSYLRFRFGMHPAEVAAFNAVAGNLLTGAHIAEPPSRRGPERASRPLGQFLQRGPSHQSTPNQRSDQPLP